MDKAWCIQILIPNDEQLMICMCLSLSLLDKDGKKKEIKGLLKMMSMINKTTSCTLNRR